MMKKARFFKPVNYAKYASVFLMCMCAPMALFAQPEDLDEITIRVIEDHTEIMGAHSLSLPGMDEIEDKHLEHPSTQGRDEIGSKNDHEQDHEYETGHDEHESHEIEEPEHEDIEEPEHEDVEEPETPESVEVEEPETQEVEAPEVPESVEVEEPETQEVEDSHDYEGSGEYEEPQEPESTL